MADKPQVDIDLENVIASADRLKLKGDERNQYVHKHMTGFGYKMKPSYYQEEEEEEEGGGGFFGKSKKSRRDSDDDDSSFF